MFIYKNNKKLESLFFEDFYDLLPQFNVKDFQKFIKDNTFIINVLNDRYCDSFRQIPAEKQFLKIFKSSFSNDINIYYSNKNQRLYFIISFDCDEKIILNTLEQISALYPSIYFGVSQCLKKEMIYSAIENNLKDGMYKILSNKYAENAKKSANIGVFNKKHVYRFDAVENTSLPKINTETESLLIAAFNSGNIERVVEIVNSSFENIENHAQCMYVANNFLFYLHNILNKNNISIDDLYGNNVNLYRWIAGTTKKDVLVGSITKWYKKAFVYIDEHFEKINDIEIKIEKYIADNYNKDISITTMAEEFQVSNQYFSRYFKYQTGNNFLETLNKYRIKKALELFNDTNLPMSEIASMTGFNNYKSFARNFKKYTGKNPSEYSKK